MKPILVALVCWMLQIQGLYGCDVPCLYVASVKCIFRIQVNQTTGLANTTSELFTTLSENAQIRSLELDLKNGFLYWGDLSNNEIIKFSLNGSVQKKLFNYAIGYPIGLAVDWSSNVLYWVDSLMKLIETSTTEGKYRKVLFKLNIIDEPRAITLYPAYGYLFWTDWGDSARIERASLSGTNRITLVSNNVVWPNDLTIDYSNNTLYWIDANLDVLSSVGINGENRQIIAKLNYGNRPHPFSLTYLDRRIYVSDWTDDSIYLLDSQFNSSFQTQIFRLKSMFKTNTRRNIGQVKVSGRKSEGFSPCSTYNNCSHLCFTLSMTNFSCGCPTGMSLLSDNVTCTNVPKHFEIYFTDGGMSAIYRIGRYVNQDGFTIKPFEVPVVDGYPVAIDYVEAIGKVYWTDTESDKIYRMKLNGSELEVINGHGSVGLAIDDVSGLMFYFANNDLVVSDLNGNNVKTLVSNLNSPQDIVYYNGYVFYSDTGVQLIGRAYSDGTKLIHLVNPLDDLPLKATGLAIDDIEERLYWCDQNSHLIESSNLDFSQRRKIIQKTVFFQDAFWLLRDFGEVLDPFDLIVHNERVYWTDLQKKAIFVADKRSGSNTEYVTGGLNQPKRMLITGDIPHEALRKVYTFSFNMDPIKNHQAKCFSGPVCSRNKMESKSFPESCPPGYKETNYGYSCSNCSDALGANFKCLCSDWMTCAQRGYADVIGCSSDLPFLEFLVRECTQVVRTGFCPYYTDECLNLEICQSDDDCDSSSKCCGTSCGLNCVSFLKKSDHPCTMNNGNCSHLCFSSTKFHECGCPDGMVLMPDGKNCENSSNSICYLPSVVGPCYGSIHRWTFSTQNNSCVEFEYGGCGGNENNFYSSAECEAHCGICNPQTCNNGGYCSNKNSFKCSCVNDWFGTHCTINTKPELVSVALLTGNANDIISLNDVISAFVYIFSNYCSEDECLYADSTRKRRFFINNDSPTNFTEDNFYISQFQHHDTNLDIVFAVVSENVVMKKESVQKAFKAFNSYFEDRLNVTIIYVGDPKKPPIKWREHDSVVVPAVICLVIVISILVMLVIYLKYKRRPLQPGAQVNWSFSNQQYSDTYPHDTSLAAPADLFIVPSYTNPFFHATNFDDSGNSVLTAPQTVKTEPNSWVQFTDNDEPKKYPITEFVTPYELDSDINQPLTLQNINFTTPLGDSNNNIDLFQRYENPLPGYESVILSQSTASFGPRMIEVSSEDVSKENEV